MQLTTHLQFLAFTAQQWDGDWSHLCWNVISKYFNVFSNFSWQYWYSWIQPTHSWVEQSQWLCYLSNTLWCMVLLRLLNGLAKEWFCLLICLTPMWPQGSSEFLFMFYLRVSLAQPLTSCIFWTSSNVANLLGPRMDVTSLCSLSCRSGFLATSCSKKVKVLDVYKIWRKN